MPVSPYPAWAVLIVIWYLLVGLSKMETVNGSKLLLPRSDISQTCEKTFLKKKSSLTIGP